MRLLPRHRSIGFGCILFFFMVGLTVAPATAEPVKIILDTDIAPDVDDVGSVALLHALADRGEAEIVAMGVSSKNKFAPACLSALNLYFGRPEIPIGAIKGNGPEDDSKYTEALAKKFPTRIRSAADAPGVINVYRRALADQPDGSVVFVTVGYLTNASNLLASGPDESSPLSGKALVAKKVKQWVCMGAKIPEGREWNIYRDPKASLAAIHDWPTPIVFSGFEIGVKVMTGAGLKAVPETSPVRFAYDKYNDLKDRNSWDQTAVYYAVRGADDLWDVSKPGYCEIRPDGSNVWHESSEKNQTYLIEKMPPEQVARRIEALMLQQPQEK